MEETLLSVLNSILEGVDVNEVTLSYIKQELAKTFAYADIEVHKTLIKDYLMNSISQRLSLTQEMESYTPDAEEDDEIDDTPAKKKRGGFNTPVQLSSELAELLGELFMVSSFRLPFHTYRLPSLATFHVAKK